MHITSVSIIIPIYNVGLYVEDCIRSVMRQTYKGDLECIVVDDCSTDDSMSIVEKVIEDYNGPITFKVLHHTQNRGLSAARNTGMETAIGDYLFFLDSDDELTDNCIEELVEPLNIEWYDIVVGELMIFGSDKPYYGLKLELPDRVILRGNEIINTYRTRWNMMAQNKLYRKEFIMSSHLSFYAGIIHEDELWSFQVAILASSLCSVRKITYHYRIRQGSLVSTSNERIKSKSFQIIVEEMGKFIKTKNIFNEHVFQIIYNFFLKVMKSNMNEKKQFNKTYHYLRPYVKPSMKEICCAHKYHMKWYIRDIHFYLSPSFGSYWVYYYIKYRMQ